MERAVAGRWHSTAAAAACAFGSVGPVAARDGGGFTDVECVVPAGLGAGRRADLLAEVRLPSPVAEGGAERRCRRLCLRDGGSRHDALREVLGGGLGEQSQRRRFWAWA